MKLQKNTERYAELSHGDEVYFKGNLGKVYKPDWFRIEDRADIYVAVIFDEGRVNRMHFESLDVEVPEVPDEQAPEYEGTNWHVCSKTGDLFYFSKAEGWYICVNNMTPPLHWDSDKDSRVKDLKRLYREV